MTDTARADLLIGDVLARIHAAIHEHDVTYEEFQTAKQWLIDMGQAGEWPLFLDVFVEHAVESQVFENRRGTQGDDPRPVPPAGRAVAGGAVPAASP